MRLTGICTYTIILTLILHNCAVRIDNYRLKNLCKITGIILLDFIPAIKIIIRP